MGRRDTHDHDGAKAADRYADDPLTMRICGPDQEKNQAPKIIWSVPGRLQPYAIVGSSASVKTVVVDLKRRVIPCVSCLCRRRNVFLQGSMRNGNIGEK